MTVLLQEITLGNTPLLAMDITRQTPMVGAILQQQHVVTYFTMMTETLSTPMWIAVFGTQQTTLLAWLTTIATTIVHVSFLSVW